ncbi:iron complex transport system ATP-binding protein [Aeromonas sp. RU39B]|uniref:Fe(3+) dicitrate ABC transporter ATP-binding protein FecE n=1 Tax=Aeromonas sp. RU39B TaxID=1907416 RepID=UPI0009544450|nr:Fe(3+) dicitrate ABC transporter ATP-binding protein FecE [Aeromonas sp. RU39B]SIQ65040.1 iron complex transport system ATP-binding protein [Aeromonas sp. RU39B]
MLTATALEVGYDANPVLHSLNLAVPHGRFTALIGPNGCGKSTLLKTLARVLKPAAGTVCWQGQSITSLPARQLARELALLPQTQPIPEGITVRQLVGYGRAPHGGFWGRLTARDQQLVAAALKRVGLDDLAERPLASLSGGQRQRAWLAMVLAQDTAYLLLDEPTTYLDINHQVELMNLLGALRDEGRTLVAVLHDLNQACRYADHLVVMKEGRIMAEGAPGEVMTRELLREVFHIDAQIFPDPLAGTPMIIVK